MLIYKPHTVRNEKLTRKPSTPCIQMDTAVCKNAQTIKIAAQDKRYLSLNSFGNNTPLLNHLLQRLSSSSASSTNRTNLSLQKLLKHQKHCGLSSNPLVGAGAGPSSAIGSRMETAWSVILVKTKFFKIEQLIKLICR